MPHAAKCGKLGFERADFGTLNELAMRQHAGHRVIDRTAKTAALGRDIDERDRLLFDARVLIHDRC